MPEIKLSTGINMYYERHGSGEPLVLIMGTGLDHTGWHSQIKEYSKYFELGITIFLIVYFIIFNNLFKTFI